MLSHVQLFWTSWSVANQAPLSMGIFQGIILEWIAMLFSRESSQPRDWTWVFCIAGRFFTIWATWERVSESRSVVSDSLRPHGLYSPWDSPGQNTGVGSLSLFQGIFPTQGSNPGLPHCGQILYHLSLQGNFIGEVKLSYKDAIVITKFYSLRKTTFIKTSVSSSVWIGLYLSIIIHCVKFFGYLWICSYQTLTFRIQC